LRDLRPSRQQERPVPRYFFDIRTATGALAPDREGIELADVDAVTREVVLAVEDLHQDARRGGYDYAGCYFEIRGEDGNKILTAPAFRRPAAKA
jgi:hypothetical protein